MRSARPISWLLLALALGCGSGTTAPESGAVLLTVKCPEGAPVPDELRAWVYDDDGRIWDGVRIPEQGPLAVANAQRLGTILVAPGTIRGELRIHLRGLAGGVRVLDGVLTIDSVSGSERTFDLMLDPALPPDEDGDDVPDSIDDCPGVANPAQGGCPGSTLPDAAAADGSPDGAPTSSEAGSGLARDVAPGALDAGAETSPDVALTSPETGAELPRDALPPSFEAGTDTPRIGSADAPDGKGATSDGGLDIGAGFAQDGAAARNEVGDGVDSGGTPGAEVGADAEVAGDAVPDWATDAEELGPDSGCGDACGKPQGALCGANEECASGACADGVCCTNACVGPCRSCNQPTTSGTCQGYPAGTDPEGECQESSTCNGVGACGPLPSNLPNGQLCTSPGQCQSGFCADGVCCNSACTAPCMACGKGLCVAVTGTDDVPECTGNATCNPKGKCVAN